jgi:hypothetical protein
VEVEPDATMVRSAEGDVGVADAATDPDRGDPAPRPSIRHCLMFVIGVGVRPPDRR